MMITRREAMAATVTCALAMSGTAHGEEKPLDRGLPARLSENVRQRLEETGPAIVKQFIAALRERFSDERAGVLRKFIDPSYLQEYGLQEGAFPMTRVLTGAIFDNQLSDDPSTALIVAKTDEAAKECFLFRLTVHEGKVYIAPLSPPETERKTFKPWILRVKV